jgi:hydrogenase nickel incorporation protein HypB
MNPRILEIRQGILKKNDQLAHGLRERYMDAGVCVIDLVSSPGAGKTAFLEETLRRLRETHSVAALVGDLATANDATRLARSGAPVRQIETAGICHLEAEMVERHLEGWNLNELDFLFIENVGNLVCPSSYDLGEDMRAVLMSVTEGEDKPLKYPTIYNSSDIAIITKIDLADAVEFNRKEAYENINSVRPNMKIFETSARTKQGIDEWIEFVKSLRETKSKKVNTTS